MAWQIRSTYDTTTGAAGYEVYGDKTGKIPFKVSGGLSDAMAADCKRWISNRRAKIARAAKADALRGLGLVRVRGALGGIYWE